MIVTFHCSTEILVAKTTNMIRTLCTMSMVVANIFIVDYAMAYRALFLKTYMDKCISFHIIFDLFTSGTRMKLISTFRTPYFITNTANASFLDHIFTLKINNILTEFTYHHFLFLYLMIFLNILSDFSITYSVKFFISQ